MSSVVIAGDTSGTITLQAPAVSGSSVLTLPATTFLASNVVLNNTANFFDGPNTGSIGASGQTWLINAYATVQDTSGVANVELAIWDGSAYIANLNLTLPGQNYNLQGSLSVVVSLTGATTFTLRGRDWSTVNGRMLANAGYSSITGKATSITAVRLS